MPFFFGTEYNAFLNVEAEKKNEVNNLEKCSNSPPPPPRKKFLGVEAKKKNTGAAPGVE